MVELTKFFVKEVDTNTLIEVSFLDTEYINTEVVTKFMVIKKCINIIFAVLFKLNKLDSRTSRSFIRNHADKIYQEQNQYREENGLTRINYEDQFIEDKNIKPNYIG